MVKEFGMSDTLDSHSLSPLILAFWAHIVSSILWICSSCVERWERWFLSI